MEPDLKKVLVVSPFASVPPRYGGPIRVHNLCKQLSRTFQVQAFAQQIQRGDMAISLKPVIKHVNSHYSEYSCRNPISIFLYALTNGRWGFPSVWQSSVLNITAPKWLNAQINKSDIIHVEHPWQFQWVYENTPRSKPVILGAQNVETDLYKPEFISAPTPITRRALKAIADQEAFAVKHATAIAVTSQEDRGRLSECHKIPDKHFFLVPNGVDCAKYSPVDDSTRIHQKRIFNLEDRTVVIFAGSAHRPNIEAVEQIVKFADVFTAERVTFLIVGSVGRAFASLVHPAIRVTGVVPDTRPYFEAADIALNPMMSGSGTNLKQLEYMAMGLPVITTVKGTRGINFKHEIEGFVCDPGNFPLQILALVNNAHLRLQVGTKARAFAQNNFDWDVIGKKMNQVYEEIL